MVKNPLPLIICMFLLSICLKGQNETVNWYFSNAGLSFTSNPPTILTSGAMNSVEGCSGISDPSGNLLFYTDGNTVWNQQNMIMANGTGMLGNWSSTQSALIVKQPGNTNIYYIFTVNDANHSDGLMYNIVDMNLAAGMGSVTTKNALLFTPSSEKLAAVRHCNGHDIWVLTHDINSNTFRACLLTAAGVSATPVLSSEGPAYTIIGDSPGQMKISPNGKKIALARYYPGEFDLFDFDPLTGVVSNYVPLDSIENAYGCEFSPDGRILYGSSLSSAYIIQWDLCAGSPAAMSASQYTFVSGPGNVASLQHAPDGKIYVARVAQPYLDVISNPNALGVACGYLPAAQPLAPNVSNHGLPNMMAFRPTPPSFTHTVTCQTASFTAPPIPTVINTGCNAAGGSITGHTWIFGDPASGASNNSSQLNPIHTFSMPGTYTVKLVLQGQCISDTVAVDVNIPNSIPSLSVSGNFTICPGEIRTFTVAGANAYSWSNGASSHTAALSPVTTTTYSVSGTNTLTTCSSSRLFTVNVVPCTFLINNESGTLRIYPNPISEKLNIETVTGGNFSLLNLNGSLVMQGALQTGTNSISTEHLLPGIFIVKINDGNGFHTVRIVKMK